MVRGNKDELRQDMKATILDWESKIIAPIGSLSHKNYTFTGCYWES